MSFDSDFPGAIGIDYGTTYSCVGVWHQDGVEIIPNEFGNRITPSIVGFTETERLVGDSAFNQAAMNPENTVFDSKRLIGRRFNDSFVQNDMKLWPFTVVERFGKPFIEVEYKGETRLFHPEEIGAMVLCKMRITAQQHLGQNVTKAVISVPAYANDAQRQATKDAGQIAGLSVLRVVAEPTLAALAYGLDEIEDGRERTILVFDLGGGTFDVSIVTVEEGIFEVKAVAGDTHLGGEDFDHRMMMYFREDFRRRYHLDLSASERAIRRLRTACERAKRTLSTSTRTVIQIDSILNGIDYVAQISRAKFEEVNRDLFQCCLNPVRKVLDDSLLPMEQIDDVVLVGGSSRIPMVQRLLTDFFNGKQLKKSINPDEAVAYGAAIQASVLTGLRNDFLLLDVTPLSLGIETAGGSMRKLIPRNTTIPCKKGNTFRLLPSGDLDEVEEEEEETENESEEEVHGEESWIVHSVVIRVVEGERAQAQHCNLLGEFEMSGTFSAASRIEVMINVDANGIMAVTANDLSTGRANQMSMTIMNDKERLTSEEIYRIVRDMEEMAKDDEEKFGALVARNGFGDYAYQVKDSLYEDRLQTHISTKDRDFIVSECDRIVEWLDENDDEEKEVYEEKRRVFEETVMPIMQQIYRAAGPPPGMQGSGMPGGMSGGMPGGSPISPSRLVLDSSRSSFRVLSLSDGTIVSDDQVFEGSDFILECDFYSQSTPERFTIWSISLVCNDQSIRLTLHNDEDHLMFNEPAQFHWKGSVAGFNEGERECGRRRRGGRICS